jgi:hypothetical protein
MTEPDRPPSPDCLTELLEREAREETAACLDRLSAADADARKRAVQTLRNSAEERPRAFDGLAGPLAAFLNDDNRAVRLTTAKLFVALARSEASVVLPVVESLADRLTDDEEFYYVRARCAEALGYVALEHPEAVADPETLADFRVGLAFDEPEVKEKLAKALEYVALGDPSRLRHLVSSLAEHLDDENELVRYHLSTALVTIGCVHPKKLTEADGALRERLNDENPYVRGRAVEALGLLVESRAAVDHVLELDGVDSGDGEVPSFLTDRVRYVRRLLEDDEQAVRAPEGLGTVDSVRNGTDHVVEEITSPDGDECPHCGLILPNSGPPRCPRCGTPR